LQLLFHSDFKILSSFAHPYVSHVHVFLFFLCRTHKGNIEQNAFLKSSLYIICAYKLCTMLIH